LELIDDQKDQIKKLSDKQREEMQEMFAGMRDLSQEERREKMAELQPKMEEAQKKLAKQVDEVLMPTQRDRLKQITIQIQGTAALGDDEVAKELGLSDDQQKQIQQVRTEAFEKMRESFRPGDGGDREARREQFQKAQKETDDKVLAVLTSEQRDKFEKMKGEKFEFDRSQLFGGFGGPGGGGRGQRRGGGNNN
jgi:hypothetical protein